MGFWAWTLQLVLLFLGGFMMLLVLLQRGRGGGLVGALGGPGGQSAFGTRAGDVFTRITIIVATLWVVSAGVAGIVLRNAAAPDVGLPEDVTVAPGEPADTPSASPLDDAAMSPALDEARPPTAPDADADAATDADAAADADAATGEVESDEQMQTDLPADDSAASDPAASDPAATDAAASTDDSNSGDDQSAPATADE